MPRIKAWLGCSGHFRLALSKKIRDQPDLHFGKTGIGDLPRGAIVIFHIKCSLEIYFEALLGLLWQQDAMLRLW